MDTVCRNAFNKDAGVLINVSRGILFAGGGTDFAQRAHDEAKKYQKEMEVFF